MDGAAGRQRSVRHSQHRQVRGILCACHTPCTPPNTHPCTARHTPDTPFHPLTHPHTPSHTHTAAAPTGPPSSPSRDRTSTTRSVRARGRPSCLWDSSRPNPVRHPPSRRAPRPLPVLEPKLMVDRPPHKPAPSLFRRPRPGQGDLLCAPLRRHLLPPRHRRPRHPRRQPQPRRRRVHAPHRRLCAFLPQPPSGGGERAVRGVAGATGGVR